MSEEEGGGGGGGWFTLLQSPTQQQITDARNKMQEIINDVFCLERKGVSEEKKEREKGGRMERERERERLDSVGSEHRLSSSVKIIGSSEPINRS